MQNYKSIKDSGECRLSDNDNLLILAGQNESGKSSILQALYDFGRGRLKERSRRNFLVHPKAPIITCTYKIEKTDGFLDGCLDQFFSETPDFAFLEKYLLSSTEVTLTRDFSMSKEPSISFAEDVELDLCKLFKEYNSIQKIEEPLTEPENPANPEEPSKNNTIEIEENDFHESCEYLALEFYYKCPKIIFFDDFCDLLPDEILISDLTDEKESANGYQAVRNIEKVTGFNLTSLDELDDAASSSRQDDLNRGFTVAFNKKWKQKIHGDNEVKIRIQYKQGGPGNEGAYLRFFILTKDREYLTPNQRSQGLQWFLALYIQLTAESKKTKELIILFDEPGLFLHSKAQNNIKSLFEEICEKDQIIYSTHSPYLIDADKLHQVRLVLNTKNDGTIIEKITTQKTGRQLDALKPIIDAVGLDVAHSFSPLNCKNVLLEGIADFNYFSALKKLISPDKSFNFVPSMGASNVHLLVELCIGWGLDWVIIFDDDKASNTAEEKIINAYFDGIKVDAEQKVYRLNECEGIETMFNSSDFKLVIPEDEFPKDIKKLKNLDDYGGKEIVSRLFLEKVNSGKIIKSDLGKSTITRFEEVFEFINKNL